MQWSVCCLFCRQHSNQIVWLQIRTNYIRGIFGIFGFGGQTDYYMDEQKAVKTSGEQDKHLWAVISTASGSFRNFWNQQHGWATWFMQRLSWALWAVIPVCMIHHLFFMAAGFSPVRTFLTGWRTFAFKPHVCIDTWLLCEHGVTGGCH